MRILLLSDANSPHTLKWAKSLAVQSVKVFIWSFNTPQKKLYDDFPEIRIVSSGTPQSRKSYLSKLKYLTALSSLKSFINEIKPDIVHAHYATSYGLLGRLSKFKPFIISVWGADVYDFPKKGYFFKRLVQGNLASADLILSTSEDMKKVTKKLINRKIIVTPFGIDLNVFQPIECKLDSKITIGSIKTLEEKYGMRYLIKAYSLFKSRVPNSNTELLIVGGGSQEQELKKLTKDLKIDKESCFTGLIPYSEIPKFHNKIDIAVFPSILDSESFGVAAVEASASGKPVIVSDVGGLPEVIIHNETGLVVPPKDSQKLSEAIELLYQSKDLREGMGRAGRRRVEEYYDLKVNVAQMIEIYEDILKK